MLYVGVIAMSKSREEKSEKRAWGFANADEVEWQRHIENPDLRSEVERIQRNYGFPITSGINHISAKEVVAWMGWDEPITINEITGR
jgi:hypothetical protein